MRWKSRFFLEDREGEERVRSKFLLYPRRFNAKHWRWLERAYIKERVLKLDVGGMEWGKYAWRWKEVGFVDATPKEEKDE